MSKSEHIGVIKAALSDFLYFQVKTGTDQAEFHLTVETESYVVNWGGGEFLIQRWGGDEEGLVDGWRVPAAFLEPTVPDGPQASSIDRKPPESGGEPSGYYTVANSEGQEGAGRWDTVAELVRELHPLRTDLRVLVVEADGTRRGLDTDEAIEMGLTIQALGGVSA